jgi:glycine cleavage system H protein
MKLPADLKYSKDDSWVRVEAGVATVGLTEYAVEQLSDIVDVELPVVGQAFKQGERFGGVESVKAASDLCLAASGDITATNDRLAKAPDTVNADPYGAGWLIKFTLTNAADLAGLMDAAAYQSYCVERHR